MGYHETVIVGAGPAGLAVAGRLRAAGRPFLMLEGSDRVADRWHRHYDRLHLHTVKETSHLPGRPFPSDYPRYVPRKRLVAYYEEYARDLDLRPRFGEEVVSVRKGEEGAWTVDTAAGRREAASNVVVATGFNRVPRIPAFPGQEIFRGEILHSVGYRNAAPYRGRDVLVVGMGNTGAEIALDLAENGARPTLSVRSPVNVVPRDILGRPTQLTAMLLARLPDRLGDMVGVLLRRLTVGDLSRWGLETPALPPAAQLRKEGKTPVIDVGTLAAIKAGRIRVRPGIDRFTADGAVFTDGSEESLDAAILATGYEPRVGDFLLDADGFLNERGHPDVVAGSGRHRGLFFVGFDAYSVGGILGTILRDSETVAGAIAGDGTG